jgi:hypothetical protein
MAEIPRATADLSFGVQPQTLGYQTRHHLPAVTAVDSEIGIRCYHHGIAPNFRHAHQASVGPAVYWHECAPPVFVS